MLKSNTSTARRNLSGRVSDPNEILDEVIPWIREQLAVGGL